MSLQLSDTTTFRIELEDDVTAMLIALAEASHCEPRSIAAALLTDVLRDDALMHDAQSEACHLN
jgi:hypothetical protein